MTTPGRYAIIYTHGTKECLQAELGLSLCFLDGSVPNPRYSQTWVKFESSRSTFGAVDGDLLEVGQPRGRQPVALHRLVVLPVLGAGSIKG